MCWELYWTMKASGKDRWAVPAEERKSYQRNTSDQNTVTGPGRAGHSCDHRTQKTEARIS